MSDPLFSVVIACYNQEEYVKDSVESAQRQRHPSKEVIVVDDCSSDRTAETLLRFGSSIVFAGMQKNGGACAARNHGAALAKGKYLVFLDGDDVLMPWALDVYNRIIENRNPKLILGRAALFQGSIPDVGPDIYPGEARFVEYSDFLDKDRPWVYNSSSLVVERVAFQSTGGWSTDLFHQDSQDLLNKLSVAASTILVIDPETVWYRMHSMNAIRNISAFLRGIRVLLAKSRAGAYPGGPKWRLKRSAWFGGLIFYWVKEGLRAGLYMESLRTLGSGWWMVLLAVIRRGVARIIGRKPVQSVSM